MTLRSSTRFGTSLVMGSIMCGCHPSPTDASSARAPHTTVDVPRPPAGDGGEADTSSPKVRVAVAGGETVSVAPPNEKGANADRSSDAQAITHAWNRAMDQHDTAALFSLYASSVCFYGRVLPRTEVMQLKRVALGATSSFHQELRGELAEQVAGGYVIVSFTKISGTPTAQHEIRARLALRPPRQNAKYEIVEETDDASQPPSTRVDACRELAWKQGWWERCDAVVSDAVMHLPRVRHFFDDALARDPDIVLGGVGPVDKGDGTFLVGRGFQRDSNFEPHLSYTVDSRSGSVDVDLDGQAMDLPQARRRVIASVCTR